MTAVETYTKELIYELRLRDIPGDVIGDAVAQVESHIADTGEDPADAFGSPPDYAATFGEPKPLAHLWPRLVAGWLTGFALSGVIIDGVFALIRGDRTAWGIDPVVAIVAGSLGLVTFFAAITFLWGDRIKDPRKTL
ncbi:hypothetical protein [Demequina lutea]|uniref:Uncharacterized protein n=1 Tax=Demequina lutea TaxID=431489 RepID=A0A7Y9ZB92_9MICO|nr:hypothetical protein [Demequina lutea]NYI41003.1 hypothetical protein [Demequina lutea]